MKLILANILLVVFCLLCYYESLDGEYVFDDRVAIVKNRDVTDSSLNLKRIFNHDFWGQNITETTSHKSYRPLTTIMFWLEYNYFKRSSFAMKTINLMIHCINTTLVFLFFHNITSNFKTSFVGAGLFATHPVHTEAVCGIVGRAELMFSLCYLISLFTYSTVKRKDSKQLLYLKYFFILCLSTIGILFKENAISILPSCICYDIVMKTNLLQRTDDNRLFIKKHILYRCGFLALFTLILIIGRLNIQNFESPTFKPMDNPIGSAESYLTKFLSQGYLYVLNIWILLCPEWLSFDWAMGCVQLVESLLDPRCFACAFLYWALYRLSVKSNRLILLSISMLIIPFMPASGIIRVGFVIAERILYVPSIGFSLLIALGFTVYLEHLKELKEVLYISFFALILFYILRTRQRGQEWTTEERLFYSALDVCPNNAKVHYNIARVATDKGRKEIAFKHYKKAVELFPQYESALMNLGNLYRDAGDLKAAEFYLKKSIEAYESFPTAWMNLGIVQASQKNYAEALKSYEKALSYKRRYPNCLYNMGNLFLDMKNYSMAMKYWHESVALNPWQPKAFANILTLLDNRGLFEDVLRMSERALKMLPYDTSIMFITANVHGKLKNYIEAEQLYLQIIRLEPRNAVYHSNLGVLYQRWGKKDLAMKYYKAAISLDVNLKTARNNLRRLMRIK